MSHFKMFKTLLRLSLFLIVVSVLGCGQTTTEGEQTSQVMFTPPTRIHQPTFRPRHQPQDGSRVAIYDVSDLLISIPNYDLPQNTFIWTRVNARDLPSAGADEDIPVSDKLSPASGSLTKEKMQDRIRESIQATISRESWKSPMLLQYRDDAMIVRQTEENHKQIESLLGKMRATRKYSVQTEARVFVVSAAEAEKIQSSIDERSFDFDPPTSSKINNKKKSENGICKAYLSPEKFKEMGDYLDAQKVTSFAAPRLTTYNGQKAYVLVESPMTMDVSRYLARIRYDEPTEPTFENLLAMHRAHMLAIPFENLDITLGRELVLSIPALYEKVVEGGRGGFCYELNGLFQRIARKAIGSESPQTPAGLSCGNWGEQTGRACRSTNL